MFYIIMILRKISKFPSIQNHATTADISDNICLYITSCAPLFICEKKIPFAHIIKIHLLQFVSQQTACGQLHYSNYDILILFPQNNYPHAVFPLGIFSLAHMDRPLPNAALFYFLCS